MKPQAPQEGMPNPIPVEKWASLHCEYDEFRPGTYRGVRVVVGEYANPIDEVTYFSGEGFFHDRYRAEAFVAERGLTGMHMSSMDHFISDAVKAFSKREETP